MGAPTSNDAEMWAAGEVTWHLGTQRCWSTHVYVGAGLAAAAYRISRSQDRHIEPPGSTASFTPDTKPLDQLLASSSGKESIQRFLTSSPLYFVGNEDQANRPKAMQHALGLLAFCNDVENYMQYVAVGDLLFWVCLLNLYFTASGCQIRSR
jgi:hypothetical protein